MAIDFPNSPSNGQTFTVGSFTWQYDGEKWVAANGISLDGLSDVTAPSPASGDFLKWNGSAWVNDVIDLGTDTTGNYVSDVTAGTGVTVTHTPGEGSSPTIAIGQAVGTTDNPTFAGVTADAIRVGITAANEIDTASGNLTIDSAGGTVTVDDNLVVSGDLTVNGTTTTVNTTTLNVSDNIVVLNNDVTGTPTENAGIEVERGTSPNVLVRWNETNDKWEITNDGSTYGNIVTTSDSGTVTSAMIADGTIVNGDISNSAAIALSKLASGTSGQVVIANATGVPTYTTLSGDITVNDTGVVSIAANSVALGTDTTGNYMAGVSAGTGISVTHTPGEGSTATIGLNATLDDLSNVTVTGASAGDILKFDGSIWTAASAGAGGGASVTVSDTPPASPSEGDLWFESDTTRTYVYYDSFWIEVGSTGAGATTSDTAPTNPVQGQFWFNSLNGATYVYYGTVWLEVGAVPINTLLSTIQAKGDLLVGTAASTVDNLGAGTTGQVLTVDPTTATGLKWADSQGGGGLNTSTDGVFITMAIGM